MEVDKLADQIAQMNVGMIAAQVTPPGYVIKQVFTPHLYQRLPRPWGTHTRTSLASESASGSLTREPDSDIFHHTRMSGFPKLAHTFQYPE